MTEPLNILILSDGKMGDLAQCRGVASALTAAENVTEYVVQQGVVGSLPFKNMPLPRREKHVVFAKAEPADIVIASGRRTVPYLRALNREATNQVFKVFLKDPRYNYDVIDFIWAPAHDGLVGPNVLSTDTSPHILSPKRLEEARKSAGERFAEFDPPILGLILGGNSKAVTWDEDAINRFTASLGAIPSESAVLVTPSRRTPGALLSKVQQSLEKKKHWIWDGTDENPYGQILALADRLIITGDSHNMVSEALATGKPVHVFRPPGLHKKLHAFLDGLEEKEQVHDLSKGFSANQAEPIDATHEIAAELLRRFRASVYCG